jgi:hypothetical protein
LDLVFDPLDSADRFKKLSPDDSFGDILFPASLYPPAAPTSTSLYFVFAISGNAAGISLASALDAFQINAANSCIGVILRKIECKEWDDTNFPALFSFADGETNSAEGKKYGVKIDLEITNAAKFGLLSFIVSPDLSDTLGNKLGTQWQAVYNKK